MARFDRLYLKPSPFVNSVFSHRLTKKRNLQASLNLREITNHGDARSISSWADEGDRGEVGLVAAFVPGEKGIADGLSMSTDEEVRQG
jgi:hypothetical protein